MTKKMTPKMEPESTPLVVYGTSENVEAEYGSASDEPFTLLMIEEGEVISVEGFKTREYLIAAKRECEGCNCSFEGML